LRSHYLAIAASLFGSASALAAAEGENGVQPANAGLLIVDDGTALLGVLVAGGVAVLWLLASVIALRRSRDEARRANQHLSESNESLAKALRARSDFLATTSHEIRTPLNGILGMTQVMLADGRVAPEMKERIEIVHGAGEMMRLLVDDILDLAKIENGNLPIALAPYDPGRLFGEVARFWRAAAQGKGLSYAVEIGALPARVMGDEARLRQILFNLLSNAVKFTSAGCVTFKVRIEDERLVIIVSDTGIGIAYDEHEAIFERFYQAEGSTSSGFGGTGLGLTICRHLAGAMGGSITVESAVGEGTSFRIDMPMELADPVFESGDTPAIPAIAGGKRLLVVEPNPLARRIMAHELHEIPVLFVETVDAACARIAEGGVGPVLLQADSFLVGDEPLAEIGRVTQRARAAGIPLILLHTPSDRASDEDLIAIGASIVIAKPVAMKHVIASLGLTTTATLGSAVSATVPIDA
jgi:signal transduction histidine kinase